jgi:hypothetical protein
VRVAYFHRMSLVDARRRLAGGSLVGDAEGYVLTHESGKFWLRGRAIRDQPLQSRPDGRGGPHEAPTYCILKSISNELSGSPNGFRSIQWR